MFALFASLSTKRQAIIDELFIVCDFSDVFPGDVYDVALEREVEFYIDLFPGTILVSMEPY